MDPAAENETQRRLRLEDLVDLEEAVDVDANDTEELDELANALANALVVADESQVGTHYTFDPTPSYTTEELSAIAETRSRLLSGGDGAAPVAMEQISGLELAVTVLNCKLDVDKAVRNAGSTFFMTGNGFDRASRKNNRGYTINA